MMNFGDKLLCKKNSEYPGVIKDKWYTIGEISVNISNLPFNLPFTVMSSIQLNDGSAINYTFSLNEKDVDSYYLWYYFYSKKELRKKKLTKIENGKRI